jgi:nucleoside-diphosphate-sugar epimerase
MLVAVLGSTGVVGRNFVPRLLEAGHGVRAGVRSGNRIATEGQMQTVEADILDIDSLRRFIRGTDVVVNLASSIPRSDGKGDDWRKYDEIRRQGTQNLMRACDETGVGLVAQSVSMLHCVDTSRPQIESDPLTGHGILASSYDQERMLAAWRGSWRIVRGGLLYGPGTAADDTWFQNQASGELRVPADGEDWATLVHIADLAAAFLTVIEKAPPRTAWIAANDESMRWRDIFHIVAMLSRSGNGEPGTGAERRFPSFRVSNQALKGLGWTPRYPGPRSGLVASAEKWRA